MENSQKPIVSICSLTYNHEKYIKKALDSMLNQKTTFPFEIIIHDDASTDNTQNIILSYQKKYPNIIKPILQQENQYSQGIKPTINIFKKVKGKYVAICEGDDYWIDEYKLQKQVDFLENNPGCTICDHNVIRYFEQEDKFERENSDQIKPKKTDLYYFLKNEDIRTVSILFKAWIIKDLPNIYYKVPFGDLTLKILCLQKGKLFHIDKYMAVYRRHSNNMTSNPEFIDKALLNLKLLRDYLKNNKKAAIILLKKMISQMIIRKFNGEKKFGFFKMLKSAKNLREFLIIINLIIFSMVLWLISRIFPISLQNKINQNPKLRMLGLISKKIKSK